MFVKWEDGEGVGVDEGVSCEFLFVCMCDCVSLVETLRQDSVLLDDWISNLSTLVHIATHQHNSTIQADTSSSKESKKSYSFKNNSPKTASSSKKTPKPNASPPPLPPRRANANPRHTSSSRMGSSISSIIRSRKMYPSVSQ